MEEFMKKLFSILVLSATLTMTNINCMNIYQQIAITLKSKHLTNINRDDLTLFQKMTYVRETNKTLKEIKNIMNEIKNYEHIKQNKSINKVAKLYQLHTQYSINLSNLICNAIIKPMQLSHLSYPTRSGCYMFLSDGITKLYYKDLRETILSPFKLISPSTKLAQDVPLIKSNLKEIEKKLITQQRKIIKEVLKKANIEKSELKEAIKTMKSQIKKFKIIANANNTLKETIGLFDKEFSGYQECPNTSLRMGIHYSKYNRHQKDKNIIEKEKSNFITSQLIPKLEAQIKYLQKKIFCINDFTKTYKVKNPQAKKDFAERANFILSL